MENPNKDEDDVEKYKKEIDDLKSKTSRWEDEMLECLDQVDALETALSEKEAAFKQHEKEWEEEKSAIQQEAVKDELASALATMLREMEGVSAEEEIPVTIRELDVRDTIREFRKFEARLEKYRSEVSEGQKTAAEVAAMLLRKCP